MRLQRSSTKPWVQGKGYRKRTVLEQSDLGIPGSFLQEVSFRKGDVVPIHHHRAQTEVFYAVTDAVFEINGEMVTMAPGDVLVCEPGDRHGNPEIPHDMKILVLKVGFIEDDTVW
jgi:quercetin dioxygenase-like cupin family protein